MKIYKNKILAAVTMILIVQMIMPQAFSLDYGVSLGLDTNYVRVGPCSGGTMVSGTLENKGTQQDTYTLTPQNSWVIITPQKVTLNAGETKKIAIFMTPPCDTAPKEYPIEIIAQSDKAKDTETITIDVLRVHSVELTAAQTKTGCIGDKESYDLDISNLGKTKETFSITSTRGILDNSEVTLDAGESEKVILDVPITSEKDTIGVSVKSTTSYAENSKTLSLLGKSCYSQDITIAPQSKTTCMKESTEFILTIKNTGTKKEMYTMKTDFGDLSTDTLSIEAGSESKVKLTVTPEDSGKYTSNIEIISPHYSKKVSVSTSAESCKGVAVITIPKKEIVCKGDNAQFIVTVKNTGKTEDKFSMSSTIGVLSEKNTTIKAGDTVELYANVSTKDLDYKTYPMTVTAQSDEVSDTSISEFTIENCYSAALNVDPEIVRICPKNDASFTVTVTNTGKNKDTYTLETSSGQLSENQLSVESAKIRSTTLTIPSVREDKTVVVNLFSGNVQASKTVNVTLKDTEKCYGFTASANPEIIEAQDYKGYLYTLTVKNKGEYTSNFSLSVVGGPDWVFFDPKILEIETGSEGQFYIYVSPPYGTQAGEYNINLEVKRNGASEKTVTLKLIMDKSLAPPEKENKTSGKPEEKPEPTVKTFSVTVDTEVTYELKENYTETVEGTYVEEGNEKQLDITFRTGSFIIEIDNATIEDQAPEIGDKTYYVSAENRRYTITLEFTEVDTQTDTYRFRIKSVEFTEIEKGTTPTGKAIDENLKVPKNLIYATIVGLIIIILILFGPEIVGKTKDFFTEEKDEKKEEEEVKVEEKPAQVSEPTEETPLEEIKGIGGKRAEALRKAGITSVEKLAEANISDVMAEAVISENQAKDIIKKAKSQLKKKHKKDDKEKTREDVKEDIKNILESI